MATQNILTENELKINLLALKEKLNKIEINPIKNILFFNLESYYSYLDEYYYSSTSLAHIMKILEPYIPLALCMDTTGYELLMNAAESDNAEEINKIKNEFYKKAVFKFFEELKKANTEEELDYIFNLCNNLRIIQS